MKNKSHIWFNLGRVLVFFLSLFFWFFSLMIFFSFKQNFNTPFIVESSQKGILLLILLSISSYASFLAFSKR